MKTLSLLILALGLALPAAADISDSGNLTLGGNGIVAGTMTVQGANPFSLVTSSGIQILKGGLQWPDGTTSYTATSGVRPSSWTVFFVAPSGYVNSVWNGCNLQSSSVTVTLSGGWARVWAEIPFSYNTSGASYANFLQDSNFVAPFGASVGAAISGTGANYQTLIIHQRIPVTAGSHTYCFGIWTEGGGTMSVPGQQNSRSVLTFGVAQD